MKILIVSTNIHREPEPVFPIGPAYLCAALGKSGHEVRCLDLMVEGRDEDELKKKWPPRTPTSSG